MGCAVELGLRAPGEGTWEEAVGVPRGYHVGSCGCVDPSGLPAAGTPLPVALELPGGSSQASLSHPPSCLCS